MSDKKDYLDPEHHAALLHSLDFISEQTHISKHHLHYLSAETVCTPAEFEWVRNFKSYLKEGRAGLILVGTDGSSPVMKLISIGATMVRNGKDARVYSTGMLLSALDDRYVETPNPTVLIIPDLCSGITLTAGQISKLYNLILERFIANKMTIAWVSDLTMLQTLYGKPFYSLIEQHFDLMGDLSVDNSKVEAYSIKKEKVAGKKISTLSV